MRENNPQKVDTSVGYLIATWPFVILRLVAILATIAPIWFFVMNIGEWLSKFFGIYHPVFVFSYRMLGFMAGWIVMNYLRRVLLFYIKAAHIVVLTKMMTNIPVGGLMIADGFGLVFRKFFTSSVFLGADVLVKYGLTEISSFIMKTDVLPAVGSLKFFSKWLGGVIKTTLSYSDEVVLSYIFYCESDDTTENDGKFLQNTLDGIVLYVQCAVKLLKASFMLVLSAQIFSWISQIITVAVLLWTLQFPLVTIVVGYFALKFVFAIISFTLLEPYETIGILLEFYNSVAATDESQDAAIINKLRGVSSKFAALANQVVGKEDVAMAPTNATENAAPLLDLGTVMKEGVESMKGELFK